MHQKTILIRSWLLALVCALASLTAITFAQLSAAQPVQCVDSDGNLVAEGIDNDGDGECDLPPPVDDREPNVEEQVVTGSRIITGESSVSPVKVFSGEEVFDAALPSLGDFIFNEVTQNDSASPNAQLGTGGGLVEGARSVAVNLRGLGEENTLTLVDSMRTLNYAVPDSNGWSSVDINATIPSIVMTRTELLLDGGSAVYGTDAIAGVVNLIPDYGLRGVKFQFNTLRNVDVFDKDDNTFAIAAGIGNDRISLVAAADIRRKEEITDVDLGTDDIDLFLTENPAAGDFDAYEFTKILANGMTSGAAIPDLLCGNASAFPDEAPAYAGLLYDNATDCGIFRLGGTTVQQAIESETYFVALEYQFTDWLTGTINASYNETLLDRDYPFGGILTPTLNGAPGMGNTNILITPAHNPGLAYYASQNPAQWGLTGSGQTAQVGFVSGNYMPMPYQQSLPGFQQDNLFRVAAGLDIKLSENWIMILDAITGETTAEVHRRDYLSSRVQAALNGLGGEDCTGTTPGANGCQYWNPFLSSALPNAEALNLANDPALAAWMQPEDTRDWTGELDAYQAVVSGTLDMIQLPGGPIGVALGYERREDYLEVDFDPLFNAGGYFRQAGVGVPDYSGQIDVDSWFGELALPVLDDLDLQVAFRSEDYSSGFSTTNPKLGFNWQANDRLTVRGSWGTSFKAPTVPQTLASTITAPSFINLGVVTDPDFNGGFGGGSAVLQPFSNITTANPDLKPQESDNWALGFNWRVADNFSFGASFISIDFSNVVDIPNALDLIQICNLGVIDDPDAIVAIGQSAGRNFEAETSIYIPDPECFNMRGDPGLVSQDALDEVEAVTGRSNFDPIPTGVLITPRNLASRKVQAIDWNMRWDFDLDFGTLTLSPNGTINTSYEVQELPDSPVIQTAGVFGTGFPGRERHRINVPVSLTMDQHRVSLTTQYSSGNRSFDPAGEDQEDAYIANLSYNYRFSEQYRVGFTVRNVGNDSLGGNRTIALNFEANFTE